MPRPKKPVEQHVIDGTYRPCRHGELPDAVQAWAKGDADSPGEPEKPDGLSEPASKMWDRVLLTRTGTIWPSDAPILAVYCEWWGLWQNALAVAVAKPVTQNLTALGIVTDKLDKLGAKFGLSPKDRAALPVVDTGPKKARVETRPADVDKHMRPPKAKKKRRS